MGRVGPRPATQPGQHACPGRRRRRCPLAGKHTAVAGQTLSTAAPAKPQPGCGRAHPCSLPCNYPARTLTLMMPLASPALVSMGLATPSMRVYWLYSELGLGGMWGWKLKR